MISCNSCNCCQCVFEIYESPIWCLIWNLAQCLFLLRPPVWCTWSGHPGFLWSPPKPVNICISRLSIYPLSLIIYALSITVLLHGDKLAITAKKAANFRSYYQVFFVPPVTYLRVTGKIRVRACWKNLTFPNDEFGKGQYAFYTIKLSRFAEKKS